jgi:hypothetical protein
LGEGRGTREEQQQTIYAKMGKADNLKMGEMGGWKWNALLWSLGNWSKKWGKASKPINGWMGRMVISAQKSVQFEFG